jgi:hypothetical protein
VKRSTYARTQHIHIHTHTIKSNVYLTTHEPWKQGWSRLLNELMLMAGAGAGGESERPVGEEGYRVAL